MLMGGEDVKIETLKEFEDNIEEEIKELRRILNIYR